MPDTGYSQEKIFEEYRILINEKCNKEHISITALAGKLGFARPYVSRVMSGDRRPGKRFLQEVDKFLNLPPSTSEIDSPHSSLRSWSNRLRDAQPVVLEDSDPTEPEESDQEDQEDMQFNPKLEALLLQIMDAGGFDTRKECLAQLIREKASELQHATAPQSSTQKILSDAEKTIAKAQEEAAKARKELGH